MITLLIADNKEKTEELLSKVLGHPAADSIKVLDAESAVKIAREGDLKQLVTLEDKIRELDDALYPGKKGALYRAVLERVEKCLIEHILERTEGNQVKAARALGINRNTFRVKIKRLGIDVCKWKN